MDRSLPEGGGVAPAHAGIAILLWMHNGLRYIYWQDRVRRAGPSLDMEGSPPQREDC
jgi:hypothetical protein